MLECGSDYGIWTIGEVADSIVNFCLWRLNGPALIKAFAELQLPRLHGFSIYMAFPIEK